MDNGRGADEALRVRVWWSKKPSVALGLAAFQSLNVTNHELDDYLVANPPDPCAVNLVVVSTTGSEPDQQAREALARLQNPALFLLSDEKLRHRLDGYHTECTVIRNYWSPFSGNADAHVVPLFPMHAEFSKAWMAAPKRERDFAWSFVGQRKGARQGMVRTMSSDFGFLKLTESFNDTVDGLPPPELANVYSRSHFVLCPGGNLNPDTFRIMEALYSRAIPVVRTFFGIDYCRLVYGNHPFVVARSWRSARKKMEKMLSNPADLARKSEEVEKWFERFVERFNRDLPKILMGVSKRRLESGQFRIQKSARFNPYFFATFFFVFRSKGRVGRCLRARAV